MIPVAGASINIAAASCAIEPMRGNVYYYCDCGTGAESSCIAGDDANPGTSASAPRRTISNAFSLFNSLLVDDTVALCKGGAFNSAGDNTIGSNRCGAGVACNDLREYSPSTFIGTAKPIINNAPGEIALFRFQGNGGIRFLNLKLKGGAAGTNQGFFFYRGAHDVTMCNLDMDGFDLAIYNESGGTADTPTMNIKLTGSLSRRARHTPTAAPPMRPPYQTSLVERNFAMEKFASSCGNRTSVNSFAPMSPAMPAHSAMSTASRQSKPARAACHAPSPAPSRMASRFIAAKLEATNSDWTLNSQEKAKAPKAAK